jgi:hypothetical protein
VRFAVAPNDPRLAVLVGALDREEVPAAETWRRVCSAAERLGLPSPSYQHVRRLVRVERRRQQVRREARGVRVRCGLLGDGGARPGAIFVLERLRELERREELVLQEHKEFRRRPGPR